MLEKKKYDSKMNIQVDNMDTLFCEGLKENDIEKLQSVSKRDLHNHSTKGCRREWLAEQLHVVIPEPPQQLNGLEGMQNWFRTEIKPFCDGYKNMVLRWEGAFAEARRNNIVRLVMNFGTAEIDQVGTIADFKTLIESFHKNYCPDTIFEAELTYPSFCDVMHEAEELDKYADLGYLKAIDICGGENNQPFEAFLPLYKKAEKYHIVKKMHVGETGSAEDVRKAVEILGLSEVHHGINASESKETMRFLSDNHIQLNICPSSNVMLGFTKDYATHPIKLLVENGVKVTINTDDLLIFDSSIENEYIKLYQAGTLSAEQLDEIRKTGLGIL